MSAKGMKMLHSDGKLQGLKEVDHNLCEGCIFGKQKRVSFSKAVRESKTKKLELIHTDVWGPSTITSLGGSNYHMTFIATQVARYESIFSKISLMCLMLLKDGKPWLRMRQT